MINKNYEITNYSYPYLKAAQRKNCPNMEFFWSVFSRIWTKYGNYLRKSPYSGQMRENNDQNSFVYGYFSRSGVARIHTNI